jgi:sn-glycerol 3-phosphate transport system substrate-binding protein
MLLSSVAAVATLFSVASASAQVEIQWWHAMGGNLGEAVNALAAEFNKEQNAYKVSAVFKGSYTETLTAAIAAFRAKQNPHIVQVFEVGTATMMAAKGAVYPVHQLMADTKEPFDPKSFLGPVYGYYSTSDGKLLSLPFNSSTPVFYRNKEMMKKAGLDPEKAPATWPEVAEMAKKIVASGAKCGFTSQWQTWALIENFGAWHNLPFATKANGFDDINIELKINSPAHVKHIEQLNSWTKDKIMVYGGREGKSTAMFNAGECGLHIASSATASAIDRALGAGTVGISMLPYWPDISAKPQNSIIGGATLWVLQGKPQAEYVGVAKFFTFLSRPDVQAKWHQETGYVPITTAAADITEKAGFYKTNPGRDVAVKQLQLNPPTENSKGLRIGNFVQIRDIMDEELEAVWAGQKTPKVALDDAVKRGNEQLKRFYDANR